MKKRISLAICASTAFYPTVIEVSKTLRKLGIESLLPKGALIMVKQKTFSADQHKIEFEKNRDYRQKADLIKNHFDKIYSSNGVLVVNERKHNIDGYIGGNVLMEMALAFHYKKPIYILNPVSESLSTYAEVMGMLPIFLDGDVTNIVKERVTVAVGSENPVKIAAVKQGFTKIWPDKRWDVRGIAVGSGVSNQPMSDAESIKGATTRANRSMKALGTDFGVGLEGGIQKIGENWFDCGWMVIVDKKGSTGIGSTFKMLTPPKMMKLIKKGKELGEVNDIIFKTKNSKQGDGHFGLMTNNAITRTSGYTDGVISALARFIHPEVF